MAVAPSSSAKPASPASSMRCSSSRGSLHDLGASERYPGKSPAYGQVICGSPSHHDCVPRDGQCSQISRLGLVWQRLRKSRLAMAVEGLVRGPRAGGTVWGMAPWLFAFANDLRLAD